MDSLSNIAVTEEPPGKVGGAVTSPQASHTLKYKTGDTTSAGCTIKFIYGQSPSWLVYEDEHGTTQWHSSKDEFSQSELEVHRTFDRLHALVKASVPKKSRSRLNQGLAQALYLALCERDHESSLRQFETVDRQITAEIETSLRAWYVLTSTTATVSMAVAAWILWASLGDILAVDVLIGALAGSVGAWASVLQRSSKLELSVTYLLRYKRRVI